MATHRTFEPEVGFLRGEGWSAVTRAMTRHQNNEERAGWQFLMEKSGLTAHSWEKCISADVGGEDEDGWEGTLDSSG